MMFTSYVTICDKNHHVIKNIILISFILLCCKVILISAVKTAPDVGVCPAVINGSSTYIRCLTGTRNFCCDDKIITTINNVQVRSKKCCPEIEFVKQNT